MAISKEQLAEMLKNDAFPLSAKYDPEWVIQLAERVAPYKPFFIEDPIRHDRRSGNIADSGRLPEESDAG
jgi:hypothetical protein